MAKKSKKSNKSEKFIVLLIAIFAAGMTFGWPHLKHNSTVSTTYQPQTQAANTSVMTEIDYNVAAPFSKKTIYDSTLLKGTSIITTKGVNGTKTVTYKVVFQDDIIISRDVVSEVITKQPIDQVTRVGTLVAAASKHNVLASHIDPTPDPTPTPPPPPDCPGGFYSETYSHCVPDGKTGMCNSGNYTTLDKAHACKVSGIKEWYST